MECIRLYFLYGASVWWRTHGLLFIRVCVALSVVCVVCVCVRVRCRHLSQTLGDHGPSFGPRRVGQWRVLQSCSLCDVSKSPRSSLVVDLPKPSLASYLVDGPTGSVGVQSCVCVRVCTFYFYAERVPSYVGSYRRVVCLPQQAS